MKNPEITFEIGTDTGLGNVRFFFLPSRIQADPVYQKYTPLSPKVSWHADYRSLTGCRITVRSRSGAVRLGSLR